MDPDQIVEVIAGALAVAHVAAFIWSGWLRKGLAPVLALNLLLSGGVVIYWTLRFRELFTYVDIVWIFVAFELVVFVTSLLAALRVRMPVAVISIEFTVHALIVLAALVFMLTFHLTRLI